LHLCLPKQQQQQQHIVYAERPVCPFREVQKKCHERQAGSALTSSVSAAVQFTENMKAKLALIAENPVMRGVFSTSVASQRTSAALSSLPAAMSFLGR